MGPEEEAVGTVCPRRDSGSCLGCHSPDPAANSLTRDPNRKLWDVLPRSASVCEHPSGLSGPLTVVEHISLSSVQDPDDGQGSQAQGPSSV